MSPSPPSAEPADLDLSVALVGPGRVGRSLAAWARWAGGRIVGIVGPPGSDSVRLAAGELEAPPTTLEGLAAMAPDLVLLAVPDGAIADTAHRLARAASPTVVLHVSGSHDRTVLAPLEARGFEVGSLHPLRAFPSVQSRPPVAETAGEVRLGADDERLSERLCERLSERLWFAIDGTPGALATAGHLATAWGGRTVEIAGKERCTYHLAASLAAGGVVTLLEVVARIARASGLPAEVLPAYLDLARGGLERIEELGDPARALTGPLARGDVETVRRHREALLEVLPEAVDLWRELGRATVGFDGPGRGVPDAARARLEKALDGASDGPRETVPEPPGSP